MRLPRHRSPAARTRLRLDQNLNSPLPPHRTVAEVAAERGVLPVSLMIALSLETGFGQFFLQPFNHRGRVRPRLPHPTSFARRRIR